MSVYKSQIRPSTINALREKVSRKNYGKYLLKLTLVNARGFHSQTVNFDFPVTAIIGPNGGGKTTILGAAATAYAGVKPRQFFTKSGRLDEGMANWRIEYELIDRAVNAADTIRRTAAFHSSKWSRGAVERPIVTLGVSRTVPANERIELKKFASARFTASADLVDAIQAPVAAAVQKILGKNISDYSHIKIDRAGRVSLLTGRTDDGTQYSEFHFGAGESSIIRMVMQIEAMGDNSIILIEEIENGLHPIATARMVEYLIEVAERKSSQAIFTTHSNDALLPLPAEAIWASINHQTVQGKLDIRSLRAITGQIDASLAIFCEDEFAASWIRAILRSHSDLHLDAVEVYAMAGDGTAVKINRNHNMDPAVAFPSICVIDGDSEQEPSVADKVYRLPGQMPEAYVFDRVMEAPEVSGRLAIRLNQRFEQAESTFAMLGQIRMANRDAHILYSQVAEKLGYIPVDVVKEAFFATWIESYAEEASNFVAAFQEWLPDQANTA